MQNNLLPPEEIKKIPIEFAALLVSGYHIPIKEIVPEDKIDEFLERNPHLIDECSDKNNEIAPKSSIAEKVI